MDSQALQLKIKNLLREYHKTIGLLGARQTSSTLPSRGKTLKILSIDGGGQRGYIPALFMKRFCQQAGIAANELWKKFDVICGTSIGGLLSLAYAIGVSTDDALNFFTNDGPWIFTNRTAEDVLSGSINASLPSNRPGYLTKLYTVYDDSFLYEAVDPNSNYGHSRLYASLSNTFGTKTMSDVKTNVLIPSYDQTNETFLLYSNVNSYGYVGSSELLTNVCKATSAAPLYLPDVTFNSISHIDGGVYLNNPSSHGMTLGQQLYPTANRFCVLSIGTGIGYMGFDPIDTMSKALTEAVKVGDFRAIEMLKDPKLIDSVAKLVRIANISMTGGQESVRREMLLRSSQYTLNNMYYYTFQNQLDKDNYNTDLDNTEPEFMTYMEDFVNTNYNNDLEYISNFIGHLNA